MTAGSRGRDGLPTVVLHVGTLKSGTSYLQHVLWRQRHDLAEAGVLFPGERRWGEQVEAVRDVLSEDRQRRRPIDVGAWDAMRDQVMAWSGPTAIVSVELLSLAPPERIVRVVQAFEPAEVRVVITARDLARVIPSSWQESVQNRQTWTWDEFVAGLTEPGGDERTSSYRFWRQQDLPSLVRRWMDVVGPDRIHLVVVPPSGAEPDVLWRRFAPAVGVDPARHPAPADVRGNPALGAASAELVRRVNVALGRRFDIVTYEAQVKRYLAKDTLALRGAEARLALPAQHRAWARTRASEMTADLQNLGIHVHGDLDELVPSDGAAERASLGALPGPILEHEVADAGVQAVAAMVRAVAASGTLPTRAARRRARNA